VNAKSKKDDIKSTAINKKHRVISLGDKLHVINKYEAGITKAKIAGEYSLNESLPPSFIQRKKKAKNSTRQLYMNFYPRKNNCIYVLLIYK
jgi:hypothetical protein